MYFVVALVSVAVATLIVGLTAALILERERRLDLAREVGELRARLAALERVDRNPLYRESIEDQRAQMLSIVGLVKLSARDTLDAVARVSPKMGEEIVREIFPHLFERKELK